ncbi:hypothetical protein Gotur_031196 [Gossypium turneri]
MEINGEIETFKCGNLQNEGCEEKLRNKCYEISVNIPNDLDSGNVYYVINIGRKRKFKERDKQSTVQFVSTSNPDVTTMGHYQGCRDKEPLSAKILQGVNGSIDRVLMSQHPLTKQLFSPLQKYGCSFYALGYEVMHKRPEGRGLLSPPSDDIIGILDMEWAIWWMHKMGPVGQEFARKNGSPIPNLPPNKYGLTQVHQQSEEEEGNNEEGDDEEDKEEDDMEQDFLEDDDYEVTFQP